VGNDLGRSRVHEKFRLSICYRRFCIARSLRRHEAFEVLQWL
jgi:hypothetical protein